MTRQAGQVAVHFLNSGFSAHGTSLQVCLADHKLQQLVGISRSDHKKKLKKIIDNKSQVLDTTFCLCFFVHFYCHRDRLFPSISLIPVSWPSFCKLQVSCGSGAAPVWSKVSRTCGECTVNVPNIKVRRLSFARDFLEGNRRKFHRNHIQNSPNIFDPSPGSFLAPSVVETSVFEEFSDSCAVYCKSQPGRKA